MNDLGTSYMLLKQKTAESLRAFSIENGQLLHTDYITLREGYTNLIDYANQLYQTYIYPVTTGILEFLIAYPVNNLKPEEFQAFETTSAHITRYRETLLPMLRLIHYYIINVESILMAHDPSFISLPESRRCYQGLLDLVDRLYNSSNT